MVKHPTFRGSRSTKQMPPAISRKPAFCDSGVSSSWSSWAMTWFSSSVSVWSYTSCSSSSARSVSSSFMARSVPGQGAGVEFTPSCRSRLYVRNESPEVWH
jgi:hypothetical protein